MFGCESGVLRSTVLSAGRWGSNKRSRFMMHALRRSLRLATLWAGLVGAGQVANAGQSGRKWVTSGRALTNRRSSIMFSNAAALASRVVISPLLLPAGVLSQRAQTTNDKPGEQL